MLQRKKVPDEAWYMQDPYLPPNPVRRKTKVTDFPDEDNAYEPPARNALAGSVIRNVSTALSNIALELVPAKAGSGSAYEIFIDIVFPEWRANQRLLNAIALCAEEAAANMYGKEFVENCVWMDAIVRDGGKEIEYSYADVLAHMRVSNGKVLLPMSRVELHIIPDDDYFPDVHMPKAFSEARTLLNRSIALDMLEKSVRELVGMVSNAAHIIKDDITRIV